MQHPPIINLSAVRGSQSQASFFMEVKMLSATVTKWKGFENWNLVWKDSHIRASICTQNQGWISFRIPGTDTCFLPILIGILLYGQYEKKLLQIYSTFLTWFDKSVVVGGNESFFQKICTEKTGFCNYHGYAAFWVLVISAQHLNLWLCGKV